MNSCQYCNKEFSNQYTLKNHLKTSKKCIQTRNDNTIEIVEYTCEWCSKKCTSVYNLDIHMNKCKLNPSINNANNKLINKYIIDIEILKNNIEVLKNDMIKKDIEIEKLKTEIRVKDELRRENNLFNKK